MTKWIVSTPIKGTDLMKNFVCFETSELKKLLQQYPDATVEMKGSHLEDHAPLPLTDDQHVVLEWLKDNGTPKEPFWALDDLNGELFYNGGFKTCISAAFSKLNSQQQYQVLAAFAEWGCKSSE